MIGVGTGSQSGAHLDAMAIAGGMARPVTNPLETKYYPADSPTELSDTLKSITGQIASCVFSLGSQPPDSKFVNVTLGATEIPYDVANQNGWNFNPVTPRRSPSSAPGAARSRHRRIRSASSSAASRRSFQDEACDDGSDYGRHRA